MIAVRGLLVFPLWLMIVSISGCDHDRSLINNRGLNYASSVQLGDLKEDGSKDLDIVVSVANSPDQVRLRAVVDGGKGLDSIFIRKDKLVIGFVGDGFSYVVNIDEVLIKNKGGGDVVKIDLKDLNVVDNSVYGAGD